MGREYLALAATAMIRFHRARIKAFRQHHGRPGAVSSQHACRTWWHLALEGGTEAIASMGWGRFFPGRADLTSAPGFVPDSPLCASVAAGA